MYTIPCGRTIGHGEYCVADRLCDSCREIQRLRLYLERVKYLATTLMAKPSILHSIEREVDAALATVKEEK